MQRRLLNSNYSNLFSQISLRKETLFLNSTNKKFDKIKLSYFSRRLRKTGFAKRFMKKFFFIFVKFENITGSLPVIKTVNIRARGKKKLKKKIYFNIVSPFLFSLDCFIDFYLLNKSYLDVNVFIKLKRRYHYLQQFYKKKFNKKILFKSNIVSFSTIFFHKFIVFKKIKKPIRMIPKYRRRKLKFLNFSVSFYSLKNFHYYKLMSLILLNQQKLFLFLYKLFRNKIIKI